MRAITHAVTSHTLTADQAITLLASIAAHENDLGGTAAHSWERDVAQEISSLIHSGAITAAQAQADINNAVASQILTSAQSSALWTAVIGHGAHVVPHHPNPPVGPLGNLSNVTPQFGWDLAKNKVV
jgi:hypothetical protein